MEESVYLLILKKNVQYPDSKHIDEEVLTAGEELSYIRKFMREYSSQRNKGEIPWWYTIVECELDNMSKPVPCGNFGWDCEPIPHQPAYGYDDLKDQSGSEGVENG